MVAAFDPRFGEAWTPSQCLGILSLPGVWLTLAEVDGDSEPAAFALSRVAGGEAELLLLATAPTRRRQGIAALLLRSVIEDARRRGAEAIHLEVRSANPACRLYRAEGFVKVGARRAYYRGNAGERFDAETFSLSLNATYSPTK
ncbi:GNAT family N-acetyltransferase [Sphingomonas baiyangensis]|uniref:GNAT family N-acetyltransferase n=1 Tax=Sphingomonas baiyangensis TaxID=2572576 RepID=A0A4U1L9L7_9SPHN|nr:GNAT family N-acetyltransferase [Sphingomonas baiyangensis]TKD53080.1 GNAT family N-acetyltransferase [Sphingomonas baiyangensis]